MIFITFSMEDELEGVELSYLRHKALSSISSKRKKYAFKEANHPERDFGIDALLVSPESHHAPRGHGVSRMSDKVAVDEPPFTEHQANVDRKRKRESSESSSRSMSVSSTASSSRSSYNSSRTHSQSSNSSSGSSYSESHSSQSTSHSSSYSSSACSPSPPFVRKQIYNRHRSPVPDRPKVSGFQYSSDRDLCEQRPQSSSDSAGRKWLQGQREPHQKIYRKLSPLMHQSTRHRLPLSSYYRNRRYEPKRRPPPDRYGNNTLPYQHKRTNRRNGSPCRLSSRLEKSSRSHQNRSHSRDVHDSYVHGRARERLYLPPSGRVRPTMSTSRVGDEKRYTESRTRGSHHSVRDVMREPIDLDQGTTVKSSVKRMHHDEAPSSKPNSEENISITTRPQSTVPKSEAGSLKQCTSSTVSNAQISPRSDMQNDASSDGNHERSDLLSGGKLDLLEEELDYDESMEEIDLFPMENLDGSSIAKTHATHELEPVASVGASDSCEYSTASPQKCQGDICDIDVEGKIRSPIRVSPERKDLRVIQDTSSLVSHDEKLPVKERLYISRRSIEEKKRRIVDKEHSSKLRPSLASRLGPSPSHEREHHHSVPYHKSSGSGRPSKGDAFAIAEEYRRRKKRVCQQDEMTKARNLTKMLNQHRSRAANRTPEHLDSTEKEHALDKRITLIKEQNKAIVKRTREVEHDKELHS